MHRILRHTLVAVATAAPVLFASLPSGAGEQTAGSAYCAKFSSGGGYCYGTMLGFRNASDTTSYAEFQTMIASGTTSDSFQASYGGQYYYCVQPTSGVNEALMASVWPSTGSLRGYFFVEWDGTGYCDVLESINGSNYAPY